MIYFKIQRMININQIKNNMMNFKKLTKTSDQHSKINYQINSKIHFGAGSESPYDVNDVNQCFQFSWDMTFGAVGEHRSHRSGGQHERSNAERFCDIFTGKFGEVAFYNLFKNRPKVQNISNIDYECYALGQWDSADFKIQNTANEQFNIAIKTTKHFGNLLLLEEKDWEIFEQRATYKPNKNTDHQGVYDYLFFSRVESNIHDLIKTFDLSKCTTLDETQDYFFNQILKQVKIALEVVGYVKNQDIVQIIEEQFLLPQGAMLNGKKKMDASNYYFQSGSFRKVPTT